MREEDPNGHDAGPTPRVAAERERAALLSAVRESEEKYRTIVEHSNDLIWMTRSLTAPPW